MGSEYAEIVPPHISPRRSSSLGAISRARWVPWAGLAILVGAAALLRFPTLAQQRLWYDESLTAMEAHLSFGSMLWTVTHEETTPPLFFAFAWAFAHLFGDSAFVLRSVAAIAGVAVVPVVYSIASSLGGRRAGLLAAALVTFHPLLVWYSQEARSYSLVVLLSALGLLGFVRYLLRGDGIWLALWAGASVLLLLTHFFAGFLVAPEAVWLLWKAAGGRQLKATVGVVGLAQLALVPLAYARSSDGTSWIASVPLGWRLGGLPIHFFGGFGGAAHRATVLVGAACIGLGAWALATHRPRTELARPTMVVVIGLFGLAAPLAMAVVGVDLVITRNVIGAFVPLVVGLACALAFVRPTWVSALVVTSFCGLAAVDIVSVNARPALQKPDWVALARLLGPARTNRAIAVSGGLALQLYAPRTWWPSKRPIQAELHLPNRLSVREIDVVGLRRPPVERCWWGAACDVNATTPSSIPPAKGFRLVSRRKSGFFEVARWTSRRSYLVHRGDRSFVRRRVFRGRRRAHILLQLSDRTPSRVTRRLHFPPQLEP